jgi:hypothetical protein
VLVLVLARQRGGRVRLQGQHASSTPACRTHGCSTCPSTAARAVERAARRSTTHSVIPALGVF